MEKLNCKSLMIGDWVYNSSKEKCKVYAISNMFDSNIHLDNYDKPNDGCFELAFEVEPIPLTSEILEKNGFIQDGESWWYQDFRIVLSTSKGESLVCGKQVKFCYIHQFQHALKLCGINKEIVL